MPSRASIPHYWFVIRYINEARYLSHSPVSLLIGAQIYADGKEHETVLEEGAVRCVMYVSHCGLGYHSSAYEDSRPSIVPYDGLRNDKDTSEALQA